MQRKKRVDKKPGIIILFWIFRKVLLENYTEKKKKKYSKINDFCNKMKK